MKLGIKNRIAIINRVSVFNIIEFELNTLNNVNNKLNKSGKM